MRLLDETTVIPYLVDRGVPMPAGAMATVLGGGVSNVVLAVGDDVRRVVVKQALPRLRVADEWNASVDRIITEATALRLAGGLTPGRVPVVLDSDPERHTVVLDHAPDGWRDWKTRLLAEDVNTAVATSLGEVLAVWQCATWGGTDLPERLFDAEHFEQLRVDPYYRTVARRAPELAGDVLATVDSMLDRRLCLVHGDFSPKNVLVGDNEPSWVIDFEIAHIGDPAFDVAFLLTHLTLKAVHRPDRAAAYDECAVAFVDAYRTAVDPGLAPTWSEVLRHVACLLLARVRGKSPAEYLTDPQRERAWRLGAMLLADPPDDPALLVSRREAVST